MDLLGFKLLADENIWTPVKSALTRFTMFASMVAVWTG